MTLPARSAAFGVAAAAGLLTLLAACNPKPLRARQVTAATAATDLFGGSDATGGIGDWALGNGIVQAIVDDVGAQADVLAATGLSVAIQTSIARNGGALVDLGRVGDDNDQLAVVFPLLDYDPDISIQTVPASEALGNPALGTVVAAVDTQSGVASLTVYGRALTLPGVAVAAQPIEVRTIYSLRRGEDFLRLRTELENDDPVASYSNTSLADVALLGPGGLAPFVPWPGFGFQLLPVESYVPFVAAFGLIGPAAGPVHESGEDTGEVSYAFAAPDDETGPYLYSATNAAILAAGTIPGPRSLAPGAMLAFERRIYVGRSGDVNGAARSALKAFAAAQGHATGTLSGQVVTPDGSPFRASIEITEIDRDPTTPAIETVVSERGGVGPVPLMQIRTHSELQGGFATTLPAGRYELSVRAEGRPTIGPVAFEISAGADTRVDVLALAVDGALLFEIRDAGSNELMPGRITLKGIDVPDPRFGPPFEVYDSGVALDIGSRASIPYGNISYTATGEGQLRLPPGRYRVIASRGTEYDIAWQDVAVAAGGSAMASFSLPRVVDTSGWLAADLHVHASPSADSSVPPRDRVVSLVGEGIEMLVSADHDMLFDYAPVIASLDLDGEIAARVGTELTSTRGPAPFEDGVGHFNAWPLPIDPDARRNGVPDDDGVEPNVLYDRLRARGARVVQINHPVWDALGFLSTLGYDPLLPIGAPPNDFLLRSSVLGTGTRNVDVDSIELLNGLAFASYPKARDIWMSLLEQGHSITATAASDTHRIAAGRIGVPRSYVQVSPHESSDGAAFDSALREMRAIGTSGPFVEAELLHGGDTATIGETLSATIGTVALHVRVQAPCWIPVGDLRVFANGTLYSQIDIASPTCSSALRYEGTLILTPAEDTYYVVELQERLPRDTSTFYKQAAVHLYTAMPFLAFTNPLYVDVDGNGRFDPADP